MVLALTAPVEVAIFGFVGVLVGAGVGFAGSWLQVTQQRKIDHEARGDARSDLHRSRQHEWLVELQDALTEFMREVSKLFHHDKQAFRANPAVGWGKVLMGDEDSDRMAAIQRRCQVYRSRLDDAELRDLVGAYIREAVKLYSCKDADEAEEIYADCAQRVEQSLTRLGKAIRESDAAPPSDP